MVILLYLFSLLGLGASSMLLVDYTSAAPVFCGAAGGCSVVRASRYAEILGLKTPFYGVLFFAIALALLLWPARRLLVAWAAAGAAAALAFLGIQAFMLHAFCPYCGVVDGSALALFVTAALAARRTAAARPRAIAMVAVAALAAAVALVPFLSPRRVKAVAHDRGATPAVIAAQQRAGVATIIEFVDFECPYCRRLHETMSAIVKDYGEKVRLIRKQHPLTTIHAHALVAAQAACCADAEGAGDPMADALFTADPQELTPAGCEKIAARIGLDVEKYRACMASDLPEKRIASDAAEARAAGLGPEVPVFWVGGTKFRGAQPAKVIRAAIDRELARQ